MYKALCAVGLLLATLVLTSGSKPVDASATGLPSPVIVKRVALTNQTETIPITTIVTVAQTGMYRVSAYMTAITQSNGTHVKYLHLNWNDDAGAIPRAIAKPTHGDEGERDDGQLTKIDAKVEGK